MNIRMSDRLSDRLSAAFWRPARFATAVLMLTAGACGGGAKDRSSSGNAANAAFRPLAVGDAAPAYETVTLAGDTVALGGAGKVTVLNVWATWCESCREEMADLEALQEKFAPSGVRVLGVSVDGGDGGRVARFVEEEKLTFEVAHDPEQRVQQLYQVVGVPATFVIGKDGKLLWKHVGNLHPVVDSVRTLLAAAAGAG